MKKQTRFVIRELAAREIKRKYSRSKLGILWSVLNPLLSMAVLSLIFSTMFRKSIEHYPVYYLTGFVLWNFFTTATTTAMTALADNQSLILQVKLPRSVFPLSRVYTAFVNFLYSMAAYGAILMVFRIRLSEAALGFLVIVGFVFFFSLGISYILTVLYVFFGDVRHLYGVILTLWMYVSALFYPVDLLPVTMQAAIEWNPIYNFIAGARMCVMYGELPPLSLWVKMLLWAAVSYGLGAWVFCRSQGKIVQRL